MRTGLVYWPSSRSVMTLSKLASCTSVSRQARPNSSPKSSSTKQTSRSISGTMDGDDGMTHLRPISKWARPRDTTGEEGKRHRADKQAWDCLSAQLNCTGAEGSGHGLAGVQRCRGAEAVQAAPTSGGSATHRHCNAVSRCVFGCPVQKQVKGTVPLGAISEGASSGTVPGQANSIKMKSVWPSRQVEGMWKVPMNSARSRVSFWGMLTRPC